MSSRGSGPPPKKSRRLSKTSPSTGSAARRKNAAATASTDTQPSTSGNDLEATISRCITAAIPAITQTVLATIKTTGGIINSSEPQPIGDTNPSTDLRVQQPTTTAATLPTSVPQPSTQPVPMNTIANESPSNSSVHTMALENFITVTTTTTANVPGELIVPFPTYASGAPGLIAKSPAPCPSQVPPSCRCNNPKTVVVLDSPKTPSDNQCNVITPVKPDVLSFWLEGYSTSIRQFLVDGFRKGFRIPFCGSRSFRFSKNLKSSDDHPAILKQMIPSEISAGRVAGPFKAPPFPNFQVSPLGLVPKKQSGQYRVIQHLSFPEGSSVNDGIPHQESTVQYQSVDDALAIIRRLGRSTLMAKIDIEQAYKIIPIHPLDHELLGFQIDGLFHYDRTLPMGLSFSARLFEQFSWSLHWIMENKFSAEGCVHVLDDFLFLGSPNTNMCSKTLHDFFQIAKQMGIPLKHEKTVFPTTSIQFLGLEIDSESMEVRLPIDKLTKLHSQLSLFLSKKKATLKEIQSLIGLLNFACAVVVPGRAFLRRIIDLTIGLTRPNHHRRLSREAKLDIQAWLQFISGFNGKAIMLPDIWETSETLELYTDSSDIGFGGVFKSHWFYGTWSNDKWRSYSIAIRELLPIVLAVEIWCSHLENSCVNFFSDNMSVVYILNKQSSRDAVIMSLVRRFMITILRYNILFKATHVPGFCNIAPDKLSRLQIPEFRLGFPHMDVNPTSIPADKLPV